MSSGEFIEGRSFGVLKNDLLTSMAINGKLSETLKHLYTIFYHEDHLSLGAISLFQKTSLGNSGAGKDYQGRSRLAVLNFFLNPCVLLL